MKYSKGTTRFVLLIGNYCFKFPIFWSWNKFLKGCLANISENFNYKYKHDKNKLCPTYFSLFGLMNIMAKGKYDGDLDLKNSFQERFLIFGEITHDMKKKNFVNYKGKLVLCDYDDSHYNCSDCEVYIKNKRK